MYLYSASSEVTALFASNTRGQGFHYEKNYQLSPCYCIPFLGLWFPLICDQMPLYLLCFFGLYFYLVYMDQLKSQFDSNELIADLYIKLDFPILGDSDRICLQCNRPGFNPWFGKIFWRMEWQSTPVFLPGKIPWTEEPGGLQSMGLQSQT